MVKTEPELSMDTVVKTVIEQIGDVVFTVYVGTDDESRAIVAATSKTTGEQFIVRGADLYAAACEVAQQVGIELEDG